METNKETVNLQLKDPSAEFSDGDKKLTFRSVLSFARSEKVNIALKTGIVRIVRDEDSEVAAPENKVETSEEVMQKETKTSKQK